METDELMQIMAADLDRSNKKNGLESATYGLRSKRVREGAAARSEERHLGQGRPDSI